ncbi:MAG: PD-(D/E)XK nuclease family protein, partial [Bacteroidetes bacterium]|nr:PD-(D/E)XK nuclease family protein [Bacteroidota bacterium]
ESQSQFVAARIRQMIDTGETIRTAGSGEQPRSITFGDVAVLLRSRTRLPDLERFLTEYNIPYNVSAGIGFYSAQEIYDLTSYLTFLLDNTSDIDLLTILRSPFFGISENELYRIARAKGESFFDKLQNESLQSESEEVQYASAVLSSETQLSHKLTIPQLLNRILERTGWLAAHRQSPTADQRLANLRKLLGIAREFESRGFNSLYDFVERLKYLADAAREGQAMVEEESNSVKIMTVHAAKGLEFPVVVVPFCDAKSRAHAQLIVNDQVGILPGFGIGNPPKEFQLYRELEDMSEQAEVGRLFYVACTRAMDKLILTTTSKKPGGKKTTRNFTDILSSTMDLSSPPSDGFYHLAGVDVVVHTIGPEVTPVPTAEIVSTPKPGKFFLNRIPGYIGGEIYSATLLQTFRLCPTKYFLSYRLGMRGLERRLRPESNEDYTDAILSTAKGQLIHSILQIAVARSSTDQSSIRIFAENTVSAGVVSELTGQGRENLVRRITENAVAAIETLKSLARLDNAFPEQTVTRKIGDDFITGTLDLIVADDEGLHVFDYKTNRLDKGLDRIYSDYETQMKLYALLCSKLKAEQNEFDATIIFTREPNKYIRRVYAKSQLAEFEGELRSMIGQIKALETPDGRFPSEDLLPTVTQHCPECEYFAEHGCLMKREAIGTR